VAHVVTALRAAVGERFVLTDPAVTAGYCTDWTGRYTGPVVAVVRPADTAEVVAVLRCCATHTVPVVAQGGNTGLVGASVPRATREPPTGALPIVVSMTRLDALGPVDRAARQVTAGAGTTIGTLRAHAAAAELVYGVDLASRDSATVGGTIATNAGGLQVVRYGDTRTQVAGLEVVLADGSVVSRLDGLVKDSTGYDLSGLFVGSEGTLGIVTAARLRLNAEPVRGETTLVGVASIAEALALLPVRGLQVAEVMFAAGLALVCEVADLPRPLMRDWPVYVLLETDELPDLGEDVDAVVDPRLREYRERHTEAIATRGVAHKLDIAVPLDRLAEFAERVPAVISVAAPVAAAYEVYLFGHLATGNLHVNVVGPADGDLRTDEAVLRLAAELGGSISAEHGIGIAKARWLSLTRSAAEIEAMRRIKSALDPAGLLNPGVLLPRKGLAAATTDEATRN